MSLMIAVPRVAGAAVVYVVAGFVEVTFGDASDLLSRRSELNNKNNTSENVSKKN